MVKAVYADHAWSSACRLSHIIVSRIMGLTAFFAAFKNRRSVHPAVVGDSHGRLNPSRLIHARSISVASVAARQMRELLAVFN